MNVWDPGGLEFEDWDADYVGDKLSDAVSAAMREQDEQRAQQTRDLIDEIAERARKGLPHIPLRIDLPPECQMEKDNDTIKVRCYGTHLIWWCFSWPEYDELETKRHEIIETWKEWSKHHE